MTKKSVKQNTAVKRPILRYHGGKWMIAPWILSFFPSHRIYTEAYGGAASILLRKSRSYAEVYNDLDGEIVNVFRVVRNSDKELEQLLQNTPFSRDDFFEAYKVSRDPIESARRTIIKSFFGFGSDSIHRKSGFRANSNRSGTIPAHDWINYGIAFSHFIERLKGVVIENRPAIDILLQHDSPETLHYVDPPYVHNTRTGAKRYQFEMSDKEHTKLSEVLKSLKGKVVLSGYHSKLYQKLYSDWLVDERRSIADGGLKRIEVLWRNFKSTNSLFD